MAIQLPARIPDGTRFILEGEPIANGELRVTRRYLLLPGGARLDLMAPIPPVRLGKATKQPRRRVMPKSRGRDLRAGTPAAKETGQPG